MDSGVLENVFRIGLDWIEGKSWEIFGGEDCFCGCVSSQGRENKVQRKRMEKRREGKGRNISTKKDSREREQKTKRIFGWLSWEGRKEGKKEKDIIFIFVRLLWQNKKKKLNSTYWDSFPKQRKSRIHCLLA